QRELAPTGGARRREPGNGPGSLPQSRCAEDGLQGDQGRAAGDSLTRSPYPIAWTVVAGVLLSRPSAGGFYSVPFARSVAMRQRTRSDGGLWSQVKSAAAWTTSWYR